MTAAPVLLQIDAGARVMLRVPERKARRWLDVLCQPRADTRFTTALLQMQGALIGNINVQENLLLVSTWRPESDLGDVLRRLQSTAEACHLDRATSERLLLLRPAALTESELRLVVVWRAALVQPRVVVIASDWFTHEPLADAPWWRAQRDTLGHCAWHCVSVEAGVEPASEAWQVWNLLETEASDGGEKRS